MLKRMRGRKVALAGAHEALATVDLHKGQTTSALLPSLLHAQAGLQPRGAFQTEARNALLNRLPSVLQEREFPTWKWKDYNKAFTCEWLDSENVVVGTKCNRLLCLNTVTSKVWQVRLPAAPVRQQPAQGAAAATNLVGAHDGGLGAPVAAAAAAGAAGGGGGYSNCGIHAMALSPNGSMLATGGSMPADCQIMRVTRDSSGAAAALEPLQTLVGHNDWVFGITWVTEAHLVTVSRDQRIKLWHVDGSGSPKPNTMPLQSQLPFKPNGRDESYKVRDVAYNARLGRLATLTTNGGVQLWDPHLAMIRSVKLKHSKEVVCLAMCDGLIAVGSQSHVSLVDPRRKAPVQDVESLDHSHGVRSLAFTDHLLSCGSGRGRLFFFDLRANAYLDVDAASAPGQPSRRAPNLEPSATKGRFLQCGGGYLNQNDTVYREHFQGEQVFNACYSHAWDPTGTRLMTVGGPLAYGLRGCYMALWE